MLLLLPFLLSPAAAGCRWRWCGVVDDVRSRLLRWTSRARALALFKLRAPPPPPASSSSTEQAGRTGLECGTPRRLILFYKISPQASCPLHVLVPLRVFRLLSPSLLTCSLGCIPTQLSGPSPSRDFTASASASVFQTVPICLADYISRGGWRRCTTVGVRRTLLFLVTLNSKSRSVVPCPNPNFSVFCWQRIVGRVELSCGTGRNCRSAKGRRIRWGKCTIVTG